MSILEGIILGWFLCGLLANLVAKAIFDPITTKDVSAIFAAGPIALVVFLHDFLTK